MTEVTPAEAGLVASPAVECAHTAMIDPRELKPHPKNPNKHPPKQLEVFISILGFQGWRRPITVSKRSGFITKGHGALEAALLAGYKEVPIDFQDYASEQQELADIVADNQLQRMSEMDVGKLQELCVDLNTGSFDMQLTGLESSKLEKLLISTKAPELRIAGDDDEQLAGAPVEPGQSYVTEGEEGSTGEYDVNATRVASSQVRMVQLFFNEESVEEFMNIVERFQESLGIDNVTDTVLEVLRLADREYAIANQSESAESGAFAEASLS